MSAMPVGMELGIRAKVGEYFPSLYMKRAMYMQTVLYVHQYHAGQFNSQRLYELRRVRLGWVYLCM